MSQKYPDLSLTNFPESIDIFPQWLNITPQDGYYIKKYTQAMQNGQQSDANDYLSQMTDGAKKIIKAKDLNKISESILAIERFYKTDIKDYIQEKQQIWQDYIDTFSYKGKWSSGTVYVKNNMVSQISFGSEYVYIAIKEPPVGIAPSNTEYWRQLTIQGEQGKSGNGLSYRYQWESSVQYSANDAVTYDGALWMSLKPSKNIMPEKNSDSWKLIMNLPVTSYPIQENQPTNQTAGDLWFNTSSNPTKFYYLEPLSNPASANDILEGKEAYDSEGLRIVGTSSGLGDIEWNSGASPLNWN